MSSLKKLHQLEKDLSNFIKKYNLEDYAKVDSIILSKYLIDCLVAFNNAVQEARLNQPPFKYTTQV